MSVPARPRLLRSVLARRHWVEGHERVALLEADSGTLVVVGPREWSLLSGADGTRDVDGLVRNAARHGVAIGADNAGELLSQLAAAGFLDDAQLEVARASAGASPAAAPAATRPLVALPGFSFGCDGRGSCCRIYATIVFSPLETARARVELPLILDGGAAPERAFVPEHGADDYAQAVALVDGRCAYLGADDRCGLHGAGGPEAKPLGCRLYPAAFVDDGQAIRVGPVVECACVLASALRGGAGEPLVPAAWRTRADLPDEIHVTRLADVVAMSAIRTAPLAELVRWTDGATRRVPDAGAPSWAWTEAHALDGAGAAVLTGGMLGRHFEALAERARRRVRLDASWRSARDVSRRAARWIELAAAALSDGPTAEAVLEAGEPWAATEAFYLRAQLYTYRLVGAMGVAAALRDRAARMLVARALPFAAAAEGQADDALLEHPLALVEAMLRGQGLGGYVQET